MNQKNRPVERSVASCGLLAEPPQSFGPLLRVIDEAGVAAKEAVGVMIVSKGWTRAEVRSGSAGEASVLTVFGAGNVFIFDTECGNGAVLFCAEISVESKTTASKQLTSMLAISVVDPVESFQIFYLQCVIFKVLQPSVCFSSDSCTEFSSPLWLSQIKPKLLQQSLQPLLFLCIYIYIYIYIRLFWFSATCPIFRIAAKPFSLYGLDWPQIVYTESEWS